MRGIFSFWSLIERLRPQRLRITSSALGVVLGLVIVLVGAIYCFQAAKSSPVLGKFHPIPTAATLRATPPPDNLPTIDYEESPQGFPLDSSAFSTQRLTAGLHPLHRVAAYDAPGGHPLAFMNPDIRGAELTMPIVANRAGWACVLLPSANRTVAWIPPGGWALVPLPDQLLVVRDTHQLLWLRNGDVVESWQLSLGLPKSPTPLGRTFVLGRSTLIGRVYANTDVFALAAIPDDPKSVPTALRGAHIGIHTWYHDRELGKNTTDGCIRLTKTGQQRLLAELRPGTPVVIIDDASHVTAGNTSPETTRTFLR